MIEMRTLVLLGLFGVASFGCGGGGGGSAPPPEISTPTDGAIQVVTSTAGTAIDPDGYSVTVGSQTLPIGINDSVVFEGFSAGDFSVSIDGVEASCRVVGGMTQVAKVFESAVTRVVFQIECVATGTLEVTTVSAGGGPPDPDGYLFAVSGFAAEQIGGNATASVELPLGDYSVTLSGLANNCSLVSANPAQFSIVENQTTAVTFEVDCIPLFGSVQITTTTAGAGMPDPDGYVAFVGSQLRLVGVNETVVVTDVPEGDVTVRLDAMARNTSVPAGNPRTVTVVAGQTTAMTFEVFATTAQLWLNCDDNVLDGGGIPRAHDGTLIGDASYSTDTPSGTGSSLLLDGVGDAVEVGNAVDLNVSGQPYTVAAWIKTDSPTGIQPILAKSPDGATPGIRAVSLYLTDTVLTYDLFSVGNLTLINQPNRWRHVVVTHDGVSLFRMYFQGAQGTVVSRGTSNEGANGEPPWRFTVGDSLGFPVGNFSGRVDDIAFWDYELSASQVADLFMFGPAGI